MSQAKAGPTVTVLLYSCYWYIHGASFMFLLRAEAEWSAGVPARDARVEA